MEILEGNENDIRASEDKIEDMKKRLEDFKNRLEDEYISDDAKEKIKLDVAELKVDMQKEKMKLADIKGEDKKEESVKQDIIISISEAIEGLRSVVK